MQKSPFTDAAAVLPSYASDTSGVCSALYELEGMTVVHDASGCNSTYSTFDEPRWYTQESLIYISALTEMDAIVGNDQKYIDDCVRSAKTLSPRFLTLCRSPMPLLLGTDMEALGEEIAKKLPCPVLVVPTNGMQPYLCGISNAYTAFIATFCKEEEKSPKPSINILGATPLDIDTQTLNALKDWLAAKNYRVAATLSLETNFCECASLAKAHANLVVSSAGLAAAKMLEERFQQPYVVGLPIGAFAPILQKRLQKALATHKSIPLRHEKKAYSDTNKSVTLIGESVRAASLANALALEGFSTHIYCPLPMGEDILDDTDRFGIEDEALAHESLSFSKIAIADPLYTYVAPKGLTFIALPHTAFSGRIYQNKAFSLISSQNQNTLATLFALKTHL